MARKIQTALTLSDTESSAREISLLPHNSRVTIELLLTDASRRGQQPSLAQKQLAAALGRLTALRYHRHRGFTIFAIPITLAFVALALCLWLAR